MVSEKPRLNRWDKPKVSIVKEEVKKDSSPKDTGNWFTNLFAFCGTANGGCCGGAGGEPPVNVAEDMQWNGISNIEIK